MNPTPLMLRALVLLLMVVLAGCGFQLRRELVLPPSLTTLRLEIADPWSELGRGLDKSLRQAGATLTDRPDAAVLKIPAARLEQVPLAIDSNGRVLEYALQYVVEFELIDDAGSAVLPRQSVELERTYSFDSAQALGSPAEQQIVQAELERDMVAAILRRIDIALRRQP